MGVYLCANIFFPVTFILNSLLILFLVSLAGLLLLLLRGPQKAILIRWSLFLTLLCLVTGLLRFVVFKADHASTDSKTWSGVQSTPYSPAFTRSFENICTSYFSMVDKLAAGQVAASEEQGIRLKAALDSFNIEELVADTVKYDAVFLSLENAGAETTSIISDPDLAEKRASLNILSRDMFTLLTLLNIVNPPYFRLICPDAFGKGHEGWWIGETTDSPNPYGLPGCSEAQRITAAAQPIIK